MNHKSIIKRIGKDYKCINGFLSLPIDYVTNDSEATIGKHTKTHHNSGWTISGEIISDWFQWVSQFTAKNDYYGTVKGDFNKKVKATSEEGFKHFLKYHPFKDWDKEYI